MTIPGTKWWTWLSPTWRLRNGPQVPRWRMTWVENRTIPAVIMYEPRVLSSACSRRVPPS